MLALKLLVVFTLLVYHSSAVPLPQPDWIGKEMLNILIASSLYNRKSGQCLAKPCFPLSPLSQLPIHRPQSFRDVGKRQVSYYNETYHLNVSSKKWLWRGIYLLHRLVMVANLVIVFRVLKAIKIESYHIGYHIQQREQLLGLKRCQLLLRRWYLVLMRRSQQETASNLWMISLQQVQEDPRQSKWLCMLQKLRHR